MNNELEKEKRELESRLEAERVKFQEQLNLNVKRAVHQEQKLNELKQCLEDMQQQQQKLKSRELKLQKISNSIQTFQFNNIQIEVVNDFLTPKFEFILNNLHKVNPPLDPYFIDKVPKMSFQVKHQSYIVWITGFQVHYDTFKTILQRIITALLPRKTFLFSHTSHILKRIVTTFS
jgi:exoribonuclease R